MLKPLVPKFRLDLTICSKDIAEKQVPAKLKPVVCVPPYPTVLSPRGASCRRQIRLGRCRDKAAAEASDLSQPPL